MAGFRSPLFFAGASSPADPGIRSLLAPWIGGAASPIGGGYVSLLAPWMGGASGVAGVVPPEPPEEQAASSWHRRYPRWFYSNWMAQSLAQAHSLPQSVLPPPAVSDSARSPRARRGKGHSSAPPLPEAVAALRGRSPPPAAMETLGRPSQGLGEAGKAIPARGAHTTIGEDIGAILAALMLMEDFDD